MPHVTWSFRERILVVSADRSLRSILEELSAKRPKPLWIVLRRTVGWQLEPLLYAFRQDELQRWAAERPAVLDANAVDALDLHEWGQSRQVRGDEPVVDFPQQVGPHRSSARLVRLNAQGEPYAVGEAVEERGAAPSMQVDDTLGGFRGGGARGRDAGPAAPPAGAAAGGGGAPTNAAPPPARAPARPPSDTTAKAPEPVQTVISAQAPEHIRVGAEADIQIQIELAEGATPLRHRIAGPVAVDPAEKIDAILAIHGGALEAVDRRRCTLAPPTRASPVSMNVLAVRGRGEGQARIAIIFRQGDAELGTISFSVTVSASAPANPPTAGGKTNAFQRDPRDHGVLLLLIDEDWTGNQLRYKYRVVFRPLQLDFFEFKSDHVLDSQGGNSVRAARRYVEGIYKQVTRNLGSLRDIETFAREVQAIGTDMCRQLFTAEFANVLWEGRDKIETIQVRSGEPFIPWELLRLHKRQGRQTDERFLGEYNLVRTLNGLERPRTLRLQNWRYLVAEYPNGWDPQWTASEEIRFFIENPANLRIEKTDADILSLLDAVADPDFDVLHIACHGQSQHDEIEQSELIITDRLGAGSQPEPVTVAVRTVEEQANLRERTPLVFLNACESARLGPSLTAWGGWPKTFWEAGAGAFVGTSWPVRGRPAGVFATAFYETLLRGATLAEAAAGGRNAAKALGDASWLAFKVYGDPWARMAGDR